MQESKPLLFVYSDESELTSDAFFRAVEHQKTSKAALHILCVVPEITLPVHMRILNEDVSKIEKKVEEKQRATLVNHLNNMAFEHAYTFSVAFGHLYLKGIQYCLTHHCGMVYKAAKNPSWSDYIFDSEDMHLLRKCPAPVWITKGEQGASIRNILVAIDFDHETAVNNTHSLNLALLKRAATIASLEKATLHILNVFDLSNAGFAALWSDNPEKMEAQSRNEERVTRQSWVNDYLHILNDKFHIDIHELNVRTHLIEGNPTEDIQKIAKQLHADLVVMGSVGRTGIRGLIIGNTAETTLLHLQCSALVMKPQAFISPVSA